MKTQLIGTEIDYRKIVKYLLLKDMAITEQEKKRRMKYFFDEINPMYR